MIQDFLSSASSVISILSFVTDYLPIVGLGAWEFLLGRTRKTKANSTIDLFLETLAYFLKRPKR